MATPCPRTVCRFDSWAVITVANKDADQSPRLAGIETHATPSGGAAIRVAGIVLVLVLGLLAAK
jgi:hypothetical protein